jgi:hypothetical protein
LVNPGKESESRGGNEGEAAALPTHG